MNRKSISTLHKIIHAAVVSVGALGFTVGFFFVLPFIQAINAPPSADTIIQAVDSTVLPPPPPPPEEEPEEEPEPDEPEPPQLDDDVPPMDLSQLELQLNPGAGDWAGDFAARLISSAAGGEDAEKLFNMNDLDQKPRVIYQPAPLLSGKARTRGPATVYVIFVVDKEGRVKDPRVQKSSDPIFDQPALAAVKKWKFEPGKRGGEAVRFSMRVPIAFPKGD